MSTKLGPATTSPAQATLSERLLAALIVRDMPFPQNARLLVRLGVPSADVALILGASGAFAGLTQREAVEALADLGFDSRIIVEMTGFLIASVGPIVSRHRKHARTSASGPFMERE